ncbi:sugar ABC transporter substrate-binding protein [Paucibacter sp. KBW04]|uniref:substrate-binding domain-containing protein n=1 Tax=Paucibacter sp. KBW04 TaxID=2153361 RepID=UPI000F55D09D|nr:substrate-binding domain-containing protein [Paucibacter sp. KBW04]RQO61171.1 sugar ABC transporter substrate-binding protein [Paucibacter sp. KBW04]
MRRLFIKTAVSASLASGLAGLLGLTASAAQAAPEIKIGFVIKQADEAWFQDEWRFAEQAAKEHGFKLVKIAAPDGDRLLAAIDNLAAQRAQGLVVCVPDVKLGPALVARARQAGLKLLTVDDRLVNGAGQVMAQVPYVGVSARAIGEQVGQALLAEIKKRGWALKDVGAIRVTYDQLATSKERTDGATAVLTQAGLPATQIFSAPAPKADVENAFNASAIVLTQKPQFKQWIAFGPNDELVLGAVRAAEGKGLRADKFIGAGIGGSAAAANEFAKAEATGFVATVMLSPRRHGYDTALAMYRWIKDGQAPALLTLTSGEVADRANLKQVRARLGL